VRPAGLRVAGAVLAVASVVTGPADAGEWSRFRGPNGSGVSSSRALPVEFGPERNLDWAVDVPFGRSSPAIGGDRVFLTATGDDGLVVLGLDRSSGRTLWRRSLPRAESAVLYQGNDSATPTPVTDGERVYVFFHEVGVVAYRAADGEELWRHPLGPFRNFYGVSASPVLAGDRLLLVCDQAVGSFALALDKETGKAVWRADRPGRKESYATPVLYPGAGDPRELLVYGSRWIDAYEVETGAVAWSLGGMSAAPVASPLVVGDRLFVTGQDQAAEPMPPFTDVTSKHDADGDGCLSAAEIEGTWMVTHFGWLDVDASGCVSAEDWGLLDGEMNAEGWGAFGIRLAGPDRRPEVLWNYRRNVAYIPSPVVVDDVFFMVRGGIVSSLDARTGEVHKRGRLARGKMEVYASPVAADGKIYFATVEGQVAVVRAEAQWEVLAVNDLGDEIYASPAIVGDHLYVRTRGRLYNFSATGSAAE